MEPLSQGAAEEREEPEAPAQPLGGDVAPEPARRPAPRPLPQRRRRPLRCAACRARLRPCLNRDCVALYAGCQPPTETNNVALGACNALCCGCGLLVAPLCGSPQPAPALCCSGLCQLLTAFLGVGVVFAAMTGLAFCCEDTCW